MNTIGSWLLFQSWSWGGEPVLVVVAPLRHQRRWRPREGPRRAAWAWSASLHCLHISQITLNVC